MGTKLHFLITSERGKTRTFSIRKKRILAFGCLLVGLILMNAAGWRASVENVALRAKHAAVKYELATIKERHREMLAQAVGQEERQRAMLDSAMEELRQRTEVIESILNAVGIEPATGDGQSNVGGPYLGLADESYEDLTFKVDHYLEFIKSVPLGTPVAGTLTSPFGRRRDPFTSLPALHDGLDIHNRVGTSITAPAAGLVVAAGYTRGNGNYLELDHGNGFNTRYLHLQKRLVNAGQRVERGGVLGRLGNTGRSTGPHLHYVVLYNGQAVNPYRFVRVAAIMRGLVSESGEGIRGLKVN